LIPVPPPRMCVKPTSPLKSVIWDGSLILANGIAAFSRLWWMKTPKGANGARDLRGSGWGGHHPPHHLLAPILELRDRPRAPCPHLQLSQETRAVRHVDTYTLGSYYPLTRILDERKLPQNRQNFNRIFAQISVGQMIGA
jgi:hypothetical protein